MNGAFGLIVVSLLLALHSAQPMTIAKVRILNIYNSLLC